MFKSYMNLGNNKSIVFGLIVFTLLFVLELAFHERIRAALEITVKSEITKQKIPVKFDRVDYFYLPPKVTFKNLSYISDEKSSPNVILSSKTGYLALGFKELLVLRIKPSTLFLKDINVKISQKAKKSKTSLKIDIPPLKNILKKIPINRVSLKNVSLEFNDSSFNSISNFETLLLKKSASKLNLKFKGQHDLTTSKHSIKDLGANLEISWSTAGLYVHHINLNKNTSLVQTSGYLDLDALKNLSSPKHLYNHARSLRVIGNINLGDLSFLKTFPKFNMPMEGKLRFKTSLEKEQNGLFGKKGEIFLGGKDLSSPFFSGKEILVSARIDKDQLNLNESNIVFADGSSFQIFSSSISMKSELAKVKAQFKSSKTNLKVVLGAFGSEAKLIDMPLIISGACAGKIIPEILLKCESKGKVFGFDILNPSLTKKTISLKSFDFGFDGFFQKDSLDFQAFAERGKSKGHGSGSVHYKNGFDISYEGVDVDLNFINEIATTRYGGIANLSGSTSGNVKSASFSMDVSTKDFSFNKLSLGDANFNLSYLKPNLTISNVVSNFQEREVTGSVVLNTKKENISIDFRSDSFGDRNLRYLFADMFSFPESIEFDSEIEFQAKGPLDLNRMDLNLEANLGGVKAYGETYESGRIQIQGPQGKWEIIEGLLLEDDSSLIFDGNFEGLEGMNVTMRSENFDFSDIKFLASKGVYLTGPAEIELKAIGPIEGPVTTGILSSTRAVGVSRNIGNMSLAYRLYQDRLFWKGNLGNKRIQGEGTIPLEENSPFSFKGTAREFPFTEIFSFFRGTPFDGKSHVSFDLDVETRKFGNGRLRGQVSNFELVLGKAPKGAVRFTQAPETQDLSKVLIYQEGTPQGQLSLKGQGFKNFELRKNGAAKLSFLKYVLPGIDQVSGVAESNFKLGFLNGEIYASGTCELDKFLIKTAAFPYTFKSGYAKLDFENQGIQISNLQGNLNGANANGSGYLDFFNDPMININFSYSDLNIELPEDITSTSSGKLFLRGSSLPLVLGGDVLVQKGLFSIDLLESGVETVKPSKFLPRKIMRSNASPLFLDVNLVLADKGFRIENDEAAGKASGRLNIKGLTNSPRMTGKIYLEKGMLLFFQDKRFHVEEGVISYNDSPPENPELYIDSVTKLIDYNDVLSKEYAIRLILKGEASDPKVELTSQPALSEQEITSLLFIGTKSTQTVDAEIGTSQQATQSGIQLGSYLLKQNKAIKDFQKQTGTKLEIASSADTVGVNTKVKLKKPWTKKLSTSVSHTFGNLRQTSLDAEYKINNRLSTILEFQNNQTDEATLLINRRVQNGNILELDLQYKFEFE